MTTPEQLISPNAVAKRTSLCRGTIYNLIKDGAFPQPIRLSPNRIAFREVEVANWVAERIASSSISSTMEACV